MKNLSNKIIIFSLLIVNLVYCQDKTFIYKNIDYQKNLQKIEAKKTFAQQTKKIVDITSFLPKGFVKNGSVDYTEALQKAFDIHTNILMPNFPILINEEGLKVRSNTTILFNEKSQLIMKSNNREKYAALLLETIENVKIINPNLKGDKLSHKDTKGEWGMGISILSSKNITIINPYITEFWGDGIYVGRSSLVSSENIKVKGGIIDNNRRNGISIITGKNIEINSTYISNTSGTEPMAGIDIEPNNNEDILEGVFLRNITTHNNAEKGIAIIPLHFIGKREKNVDILVENHKDNYSKRGMILGGLKSSYPSDIKPLKGMVEIKNVEWANNEIPVAYGSSFAWAPQYKIENIKIIKNKKIDKNQVDELRKEFRKRKIDVK